MSSLSTFLSLDRVLSVLSHVARRGPFLMTRFYRNIKHRYKGPGMYVATTRSKEFESER